MSSTQNGLVCFTNCLLAKEDGSLVEQDLWIDERRGVILDAQVGFILSNLHRDLYLISGILAHLLPEEGASMQGR